MSVNSLVIEGGGNVTISKSGVITGLKSVKVKGSTLYCKTRSGGTTTISNYGMSINGNTVTSGSSTIDVNGDDVDITMTSGTLTVNGKVIEIGGLPNETPEAEYTLTTKLGVISLAGAVSLKVHQTFLKDCLTVDQSGATSISLSHGHTFQNLIINLSGTSLFDGRKSVAERLNVSVSGMSKVTNIRGHSGRLSASGMSVIEVRADDTDCFMESKSGMAKIYVSLY